jgi:hypothetical protein
MDRVELIPFKSPEALAEAAAALWLDDESERGEGIILNIGTPEEIQF